MSKKYQKAKCPYPFCVLDEHDGEHEIRKVAMELFGEKKTALVFDKASLKKTKDGIKMAKMRFAVKLSPEILMGCPAQIRAAYEAVETLENGITLVEIGDLILLGMNIEFYNLPETKAVCLALASINIEDLSVERIQQKDVHESYLYFSCTLIIGDNKTLRHWIVDNCFNQLWAVFESAQLVLIPQVAEKENGKPKRVQ